MASKMTRAEKERRKSAKENAEAKKKKGTGKSSSSSKLSQLVKNAIGGQKEKKTFAEAFEENTKKLDLGRKTEREKERKRQTSTKDRKYNPLIKTPTRMQKDTSPEIDNFAESLVRKGAQGFESALVGHSDRRNMKEAEDILSGEYKKRFNTNVRTGLRMNVDDPQLVKRAEEQAKQEGFRDITEWEIAKANEAVHRNDDFYERKAKLDADIEEQNYNKLVKWMPEAAEVIGSMVPTMAAGAATGGIGGMAGLTGRTLAALQHIVTGGEISGRVSGQEARAMYDAVLAEKNKNNLSIEDYRDAIQKANNTGEIVGIAEAGTEMLFGGIAFMGKGLLDHTAGKIGFELLSPATKASVLAWRNTTAGRISTAVAQRLGGAIGEGTEEAIMSLAQPAIESNVAGVDSEFSINDMIRDFGMGAAVSMVLGLPVTMADTAEATEGKINHSRMQKELQNLFTQKAQELVASGEMTAEDAANINAQISDIRKGKGVLTQSEAKEETKVTGENLDTIYANHDEAREAMMEEAKTKKDGEKITARYIDKDGNAQLWQTYVKDGKITGITGGMTTKAEGAKYVAKAQKVASATNAAERTGYQLNVRDEIVKEVSALSKAFNREVEFYYDENSAVHGNVDESTGIIYVNANSSQSPARAVIAHEMTHTFEGTKYYNKLRDMVFKYYGNSLDDKRAEIKAIYADGVHDLKTDEAVDQEVMAFFVEEKLLTDSESIKQVVKEDRSLAQKIVDWLNKVIQKIAGSREQKFLIEARDVWSKALAENKKATVDGAEKRYSFGGEHAKTADMGALETAKAMAENGESPKFILRETGWFIGTGGKWRYEIDDSKMQYFLSGRPKNPDAVRLQELYNKFFAANITPEEIEELKALEKSGAKSRPQTLDDYIIHDELFDAYPELKYIGLRFADLGNGENGVYNLNHREIVLDSKLKADPVRSLVHEIQHAIQYIEGFPNGANVNYWQQRINDGFALHENDAYIARADAKYRKLFDEAPEELKNMIREINRAYLAKDDDLVVELTDAVWESEYADLYAKIDMADFERRRDRGDKLTAQQLYSKTAGEIEARDVSARRRMTAEERRNRMPNVDEDAVIAESNPYYPFSASDADSELLNQFNQWLNRGGKLPKEGYFTILDHTPQIMKKHGAPNLPIIMNEDVLIKFTGGKHSISLDDVATLPKQLEEPVMLFKGSVKNSYVALTSLQDKSGNDVIVAIHLNKIQDRMRINRIASIYGKNNIENYVDSNIKAGNLLDADTKKAPMWFTSRGLQLPKLVQTIIGVSNKSITDPAEKSKERFSVGKDENAEEYFGTTVDFREAGYLTTNGKLLDFSGVKFGARKGQRSMDHREIADIYEAEDLDGGEAMVAFMNEGNIRMAPEIPGIDISVKPNEQQEKILRRYFDRYNGYITLDVSNEYGDNELSFDYPKGTKASKILNDIRNYFDNGVEPYVSEVSKYRYSIGASKDAEYMDAVKRGDIATAQRLVDEAAKAAGYNIKAWHGSRHIFTQFLKEKRGINTHTKISKRWFFAADKDTANSYYPAGALEAMGMSTDNVRKRGLAGKLYELYIKMENPLEVDVAGYDYAAHREQEDSMMEYAEEAEANGNDGIIMYHVRDNMLHPLEENSTVYMFQDSWQAKSADPVTYDDEGNVIPLSERFDSANNDIRWSVGKSSKTELNELIKAHGTAMREVFHNRKRADHKELWDLIKEEVNHIVETGAARRRVVDNIVRLAYETGYINNAVETEEIGENTWGRGIYIPEEYKGEMATLGGLRSINGQLRSSGLFLTYNRTKKGSDEKYGGLDVAYEALMEANPILPETTDPVEQVEALIELFSKGSDRRTLEELDEEAYAMGEENAPYLTSIRNTVEEAMDDIATFARWKLMQESREEGVQAGIKRGKRSGAAEERKKQNRLDEATMREFDRLQKQRSEDERKDAEATMRMHDKLIEEVRKEEKALSREEKREIQRGVREKKAAWDKEMKRQAAEYKKEKRNVEENIDSILKEAERQRKAYERKLAAPEKEAMRKRQEKTDRERRAERIRVAKEEYKRNAPKPAEGSAKAMYLENNKAQKLIGQFRRGIMQYLVEHDQFVETNGEVVLDENGMEIAYRNRDDEWEISKRKNTYTPSWGLTLLAEKEGIDKDLFYTIYSKIADMRTKRNKQGRLEYKKADVVKYIVMLDLTAKQKDFLYFDVAQYAYATKPTFLPGGAIKEKAGNTRGRMMEALDNIAVDMFAGAMKNIELYDPESSAQIQYKDILALADAVYGKNDSQEKSDFTLFLTGSIIDYAAQMETIRLLDRTNLLTDKPKEKNSVKMQILRAYRESKRLFVAEGEAFERMSEKLKNPLLTARYYGAKKSSAIANEIIYGKTQRNLKGEKQGKSLYEIFKPVFRADEKAGNNNNMVELTELVNCRHDIYRLRNGKGYTGYSIEECERIVARISKEHPELLKVADEIAEYGKVLLRMCVESGRISEADYQYFNTKYPYYAPTFRLRSNEYIDRKGKVVRRDTKVIRTAVGGNDDVLPLFDQFVRRTQEIVKACKKNQLASELARSFTMPQSAEYIRDVRESEKQENKEEAMASLGEVEDIGRARKEDGKENIIPWYSNGKKYDIEVEDEALLYGWDRITYRRNEYAIATALRKMNNLRRGVLTQYNPTFWLTNGIKDIQDMYLYNQHAQRLPKFHMEAAKIMFAGTFGKGKNEEALEEYLSFGMSQASIFEYDNTNSGRRTKRERVNESLRLPIEAFNGLNFMVEQTPRLAVYMEAADRLSKQRKNGGNTYTDEEIKTIAAYQASDATLNFGRSGTVVKEMNTYGFTFLNAGVQGMDRFRRMFTQIKDGNKKAVVINVCGLIMKLGIVGVGWNVVTDWIYGGDDEYAEAIRDALYGDDADKIAQEYNEMADYQRTNYLMLNIGGVWIRIPKGRLASFIYGHVYYGEKVASGEMDALDLVTAQLDLASETILFSNPITNNILGPFVDVWRNKDAWDVAIVSEYEDMGEGFHYLEHDEETTDLAIKIAELGHTLTADLFGVEDSRILDISPKKLDYLIEQYLGSYSNMIMPFLSKEQNLKDNAIGALESMIKKFYIDPTSSNRLAGDYYDMKEEFENIANAHEGDSPYAVASKVFGDYTKELKALRDEMNAIGADTSLSRKERLAQISELKEQMNELYRQGIADAKDALGYAHANYYGKDGNSDLYDDWQKTSKGADWVITTMSDSAQEKFAIVEQDGVDAENFVAAYSFINNATADKDENGKSITGSKKDKIVSYLNSLDLTVDQKMSLYQNVAGYKVSDRAPAPSFVNGALVQPSTSNMASPIAGGGRLTSSYGWRTCPFHGKEFHQAVDIAAEAGTDVGAVISGTVTMATVHGGYGNSIEITSTDENGNTVVTKYNHLLNMGVEVGDVINQGTKIGEVGSTGSSTGAHLDFRLKINNDWVDPTQYLDLEASGVVDAAGYTEKEGGGGTASGGGYSGSGSGGSKKTSSIASSARAETKYDSVSKIAGNRSGGSSGGTVRGYMLPTASEIVGRSTKSAGYGSGGIMLPKASDLNGGGQRTIQSRVATTQRTGRTGGSLWDPNVLS